MKKDDMKLILNLWKEKKYNEIYYRYGRKVYNYFVPISFRLNDKIKLEREGRFLDIYEKYGENYYKFLLEKIKLIDIKNEVGAGHELEKHRYLYNLKMILEVVKLLSLYATSLIVGIPLALSYNISKSIDETEVIYADELNDYNKEIEAYAKYINSLELSDLEIIVKVMNDMWSNIEGYKIPESYDDVGYDRLSIYMNGYGACRNMTDDFTARLNAINPEYEAFNLIVYLDEVEINSIERNIIQDNETVISDTSDSNANSNTSTTSDENNNTTQESKLSVDLSNMIGNHMVSCIKLKEENVLLIVDPTNPSIGILKNGKIHMLSNTKDGVGIRVSNFLVGIDNFMKNIENVLNSYIRNGDYNALNEKYGIDAQNKVLEDIIKEYDENHYHIKKNK